MKKIWLSFATVAVLSGPASAQKVEVRRLDREQILHLQTALNHLTVLEMTEPVSTVAVGSPAFKVEWRENKVFVQPAEPNVATNLFVWTASGRFNYELDPAGPVPEMDFAIDQPVASPPKINVSGSRVSEPAASSLADILIATKPIRLLGSRSERNRVAVYLTDLLEHDGQILIRYSIRNGTQNTYVPGTPQAVTLSAARYRESLYGLRSSQLGSDATHRVKSSGEVAIEVTNCEIHSSRIEPGEETTGIVAIRLTQEQTEPVVVRMVFLGSTQGPVTATLVL